MRNLDRFNDCDSRLEPRGQAEREDEEKVCSPPSPDLVAYREMQEAMRHMREDRGVFAIDQPEYQAAWRNAETIKNRHSGMPPKN